SPSLAMSMLFPSMRKFEVLDQVPASLVNSPEPLPGTRHLRLPLSRSSSSTLKLGESSLESVRTSRPDWISCIWTTTPVSLGIFFHKRGPFFVGTAQTVFRYGAYRRSPLVA